MKLKQNNIKDVDEDLTILFKVVDKLEQRIATLERVLQSHAKVIGEIRDKDDLKDMPEEVLVKTWETTDTSGDKTIWVGKK
jgi:prefoldin subunit 5